MAWAYLRPLGKADIHLSRNRLQLYKYKWNYDLSVKQARPIDHRTPPVYMEFNWPRREKYSSYLEIDLQFCGRSTESIPRKHFSRAPWEREIGLVDYTEEFAYGAAEDDTPVKPHTYKDDIRLKTWEKFLDLESMLPNLRAFKLNTEK